MSGLTIPTTIDRCMPIHCMSTAAKLWSIYFLLYINLRLCSANAYDCVYVRMGCSQGWQCTLPAAPRPALRLMRPPAPAHAPAPAAAALLLPLALSAAVTRMSTVQKRNKCAHGQGGKQCTVGRHAWVRRQMQSNGRGHSASSKAK